MKMRGLPGMLAPRYHELQCGYTVCSAIWLTRATHCASASALASRVCLPCAASQPMHSAIQSMWCSIAVITLVNADVLPGPTRLNRFGKPATVSPR
jgi:hypothetical protein